MHFVVFSAARIRTARYCSRTLSPDNTEQQRSQGKEKIKEKPHGISKNLKGEGGGITWTKTMVTATYLHILNQNHCQREYV